MPHNRSYDLVDNTVEVDVMSKGHIRWCIPSPASADAPKAQPIAIPMEHIENGHRIRTRETSAVDISLNVDSLAYAGPSAYRASARRPTANATNSNRKIVLKAYDDEAAEEESESSSLCLKAVKRTCVTIFILTILAALAVGVYYAILISTEEPLGHIPHVLVSMQDKGVPWHDDLDNHLSRRYNDMKSFYITNITETFAQDGYHAIITIIAFEKEKDPMGEAQINPFISVMFDARFSGKLPTTVNDIEMVLSQKNPNWIVGEFHDVKSTPAPTRSTPTVHTSTVTPTASNFSQNRGRSSIIHLSVSHSTESESATSPELSTMPSPTAGLTPIALTTERTIRPAVPVSEVPSNFSIDGSNVTSSGVEVTTTTASSTRVTPFSMTNKLLVSLQEHPTSSNITFFPAPEHLTPPPGISAATGMFLMKLATGYVSEATSTTAVAATENRSIIRGITRATPATTAIATPLSASTHHWSEIKNTSDFMEIATISPKRSQMILTLGMKPEAPRIQTSTEHSSSESTTVSNANFTSTASTASPANLSESASRLTEHMPTTTAVHETFSDKKLSELTISLLSGHEHGHNESYSDFMFNFSYDNSSWIRDKITSAHSGLETGSASMFPSTVTTSRHSEAETIGDSNVNSTSYGSTSTSIGHNTSANLTVHETTTVPGPMVISDSSEEPIT